MQASVAALRAFTVSTDRLISSDIYYAPAEVTFVFHSFKVREALIVFRISIISNGLF